MAHDGNGNGNGNRIDAAILRRVNISAVTTNQMVLLKCTIENICHAWSSGPNVERNPFFEFADEDLCKRGDQKIINTSSRFEFPKI